MDTLDEALEMYTVEIMDDPFGFKYIVSGPDGILGAFDDEKIAYRFRLAEVNRCLNG